MRASQVTALERQVQATLSANAIQRGLILTRARLKDIQAAAREIVKNAQKAKPQDFTCTAQQAQNNTAGWDLTFNQPTPQTDPLLQRDLRHSQKQKTSQRERHRKRREDRKTKSQKGYLAFKRFVDKTWGKLSEVLDVGQAGYGAIFMEDRQGHLIPGPFFVSRYGAEMFRNNLTRGHFEFDMDLFLWKNMTNNMQGFPVTICPGS